MPRCSGQIRCGRESNTNATCAAATTIVLCVTTLVWREVHQENTILAEKLAAIIARDCQPKCKVPGSLFTWQVSKPHFSTNGQCNSASVVILYPRRFAPLSLSGSLRSPSNGSLRILSPCGTYNQREQPAKQPNTTIFVTSTKWSVVSLGLATLALERKLTHPLPMRNQQPTRTANQTTKHNHFRDVNKMDYCASRARLARPRSDAYASSSHAAKTANENSQLTHHTHDAGWGLAQPLRPLRPQPAITGASALSGRAAPDP